MIPDLRTDFSPLTVQTQRGHAGGTVEDGIAAGETLSLAGLPRRPHRKSPSAVVPARADGERDYREDTPVGSHE